MNTKKSRENINSILGDGVKKIQPNEYITINTQKKSIYASRLIKKGERFTKKNLCIKGPVAGLKPKYYEIILNRTSQKKISKDEPVTWELI